MKYYICSTSVFDRLHYKDGTTDTIPGGAGIYALAGAKRWAEEVYLVCGVGVDYKEKMGKWYKENNLSDQYLRTVNAQTPINDIYYDSEEQREEVPELGEAYYKQFETTSSEFMQLVNKKSTYIYVFRNAEEHFWQDFIDLQEKNAFILWEIALDACKPNQIGQINKILQKIDVFSLNFEEACLLFETNDYDQIIKKLHDLEVNTVFLRLGKRGQTFLIDRQEYFIPSIKSKEVVDVTGGGNSSSGAVLVAASQHLLPNEMGHMANISAIMCLKQKGVPTLIS